MHLIMISYFFHIIPYALLCLLNCYNTFKLGISQDFAKATLYTLTFFNGKTLCNFIYPIRYLLKIQVLSVFYKFNKYESKGFPLDAKYMQVGVSENIYMSHKISNSFLLSFFSLLVVCGAGNWFFRGK